jgi:hypothetical protein
MLAGVTYEEITELITRSFQEAQLAKEAADGE